MTYFWLHSKYLAHFWRDDIFLTSLQTFWSYNKPFVGMTCFDVMTCFCFHDKRFDIMTYFGLNDKHLAYFWRHDKACDVMTNFLLHDDVFWQTFLSNDEHFVIMTCAYIHHDEHFYVMTYFWCHEILLTWHHDEFLMWPTFWCHNVCSTFWHHGERFDVMEVFDDVTYPYVIDVITYFCSDHAHGVVYFGYWLGTVVKYCTQSSV